MKYNNLSLALKDKRSGVTINGDTLTIDKPITLYELRVPKSIKVMRINSDITITSKPHTWFKKLWDKYDSWQFKRYMKKEYPNGIDYLYDEYGDEYEVSIEDNP